MTQMALGENLTEITASEIVRSPSDGTVDYFYLLVELRNSSGGVVAAYRKGSVDEPAIVSSDDDKSYGYTFQANLSKVRSVYWEDGGYDPVFDTGRYGRDRE